MTICPYCPSTPHTASLTVPSRGRRGGGVATRSVTKRCCNSPLNSLQFVCFLLGKARDELWENHSGINFSEVDIVILYKSARDTVKAMRVFRGRAASFTGSAFPPVISVFCLIMSHLVSSRSSSKLPSELETKVKRRVNTHILVGM